MYVCVCKIKDGALDCNIYVGTVDVALYLYKMKRWNRDSCIKPDP